ncbi:type IX secretion system membrane protein PorP/SprF [uncultured Marixanthomonas sp.]|uniref:PorP/SprF family type IX secretion system membrane protein n=1 Tax=uncultured Marixanthomonas sp. TaxID=757245 RepID=UPI0030D86F92|tara:strand:- start:308748 stop:309668 length:921 start_codon:yes stop_codon:yes gene_type:complete
MILKYIKVILFGLLLFTANTGLAQQDSQFTQYMYNTVIINPAYAGSRGVLSINGIYRNQWVGMEGAPETMTFSVNSPVGVKGVGLGVNFYSDKIGPSIENIFTADFSYTIPVSQSTKLSLGLKGGLNILDIDINKLEIHDPTDVNLTSTNVKSPVVGTGLYLHSDRWYFGLSSPNILETEHYDEIAVSTASEKIHIYLIGGYVFQLDEDFKFKPAVLTKMVSGAPVSVDISANFMYQEKFTLGMAYRYDVTFSTLAGFQVSDGLMLGYSYDYNTTELGNYNSGSHEIFLRFELGTRTQRTISPRFF